MRDLDSAHLFQGAVVMGRDGQIEYAAGFGFADDDRHIAIAWVSNDAPPPWLQPSLSRALIAVAAGRAPEALVAPPAVDPALDPSGTYCVSNVGDVAVRREGAQLRLGLRGVEYQGFPVARGVHCAPGLGAHLRFASTPQGRVTLARDSVFVVVPSAAKLGPGLD